jgi:predicted RNase H-like HicB family nuclease
MSNEFTINLKIEELPEVQFLATSDDLPGLIAQGRTVTETLEIAQDVAKKLIESYLEHNNPLPPGLQKIKSNMQFKLAV